MHIVLVVRAGIITIARRPQCASGRRGRNGEAAEAAERACGPPRVALGERGCHHCRAWQACPMTRLLNGVRRTKRFESKHYG